MLLVYFAKCGNGGLGEYTGKGGDLGRIGGEARYFLSHVRPQPDHEEWP